MNVIYIPNQSEITSSAREFWREYAIQRGEKPWVVPSDSFPLTLRRLWVMRQLRKAFPHSTVEQRETALRLVSGF